MRRLLVVDDDPMIVEIVELSLELAGWSTINAGNGQEAVAKAVSECPDAILMDVMMPGMDGPTACRHLFADPRTAAIPIILLTAKVQKSDQREWEGLPVAGVLAKPFDPMLLPTEIANMLGWSG